MAPDAFAQPSVGVNDWLFAASGGEASVGLGGAAIPDIAAAVFNQMAFSEAVVFVPFEAEPVRTYWLNGWMVPTENDAVVAAVTNVVSTAGPKKCRLYVNAFPCGSEALDHEALTFWR